MTTLRILQVLPAFGTGGVEERTLDVAQALAQAGHTSVIASSGGPKAKLAHEQGSTHVTLPLDRKSPLLILPLISELSSIIREHNIDIVHARSRWPAWMAFYAAKRCGVPFMTTFHGAHKTPNFIKYAYNSVMVSAPHTIAVSNFMRTYIEKTYPTTLKKHNTQLHVIPEGIDPHRFDPQKISEDDLNALRGAWGLEPGKKVILLPGRMTRLKGHEVLIDALPLLKTTDWTVVMVGGQDRRAAYQKELEQKIAQLGLSNRVKLFPATDIMPVAYKLADVVINPSTQPEAFGRVIIEAQAMGKPILTSNIGEPASIVKHNINGWQFDNGNAQHLAHTLDEVLTLSPERLESLAGNARQSVLDNYTKELMSSRTLEVYDLVKNQHTNFFEK